ncbi:MBL fold metallo-hydrolase [Gryllotalpicola protaetiae]|uniref:MBL fold metallo-hydrolase n=1 Tax=Gryllotalpicola protaetiae TaxID=2419771 RepID=A0A387BKE5_9MICO|nr:MBL fold metallo-hydrolase [Gryllotalpicola protaetiae]AYG02634.1 MBL fold metallo-hydrolase [Gryllotalpicola protaetiae]
MEIVPGIHRIGNDLIAVHFIVTDAGVTVVDTGLSGHYRGLKRELTAAGLSLADVRGVVLTHGDGDHTGFAERIRTEANAPVYVHEGDVARAAGLEKTSPGWGHWRLGPMVQFLGYSMAMGGFRTQPLRDAVAVRDGDRPSLPGDPQIVALPGHSPGSVAVYFPAFRAVFVGDALTTRDVLTAASGPRPSPFTDEPAEAAASLERLLDLDIELVVPGHGAPWHGSAAELVRRYRASAAA